MKNEYLVWLNISIYPCEGLFRKAISQSGGALKLSVLQRRPKEAAQRLARKLNCEKILNETENATKVTDCFYDNSTVIAECLRLVDAKKLAEAMKDAFVIL
jgi:carboxylesterase type B